MRPIVIGHRANGEPLVLDPEVRQSTHMHVIGGSGKGKSKFLQWMIERDIREGNGLCLIDWHGTLYKDVLNYCAQLDVGLNKDFRSLILLNPSQPDHITGFNPFMNQGADVATQVSRRIDATIRPWGITDTNLMPTFERVCRLLYTFAVEQGETLPNAAQLLQFDRPRLREYAVRVINDSYVRHQWQELLGIKNFRDWKEFVLSTENRLSRFLASKTIKRFMGMKTGNLNLVDAMDEGKIILVNLGSSGFLDRESARVFASLMLNEFFESAMFRANHSPSGIRPKSFSLYLDEFQEYITDDIAAMLDQVRKGGLHMVLAHQHLGHFLDNPRLLQSVLTNARIRAVFGGLPYDDASLLANEMFLPDLNTRQIKKAYYHTIHVYDEQTRKIHSYGRGEGASSGSNWTTGIGTGRSSGYNSSTAATTPLSASPGLQTTEGWFTHSASTSDMSFSSHFSSQGGSSGDSYFQSDSETEVPVWVPIPIEELASETEWTREEKVSKVVEMLKHQQDRHCYIKMDTKETEPLRIPFVKEYSQSDRTLKEYENQVFQNQGAIPGVEADRLLQESEIKFLALAVNDTVEEGTPLIETRESAQSEQSPKPPKRRKSARSIFATIKGPS